MSVCFTTLIEALGVVYELPLRRKHMRLAITNPYNVGAKLWNQLPIDVINSDTM